MVTDLRSFILEFFGNDFWTVKEEMINDIECIEDIELEVVESNEEYMVIADMENDDEVIAYIGRAGKTMWIQGVK